jgi:hypothetical protein
MPPASPAVLVALRVRGAAVAFPSAWRSRFHGLPLRTICHVGLSRLSASPKSHFSPSPLPCASPGGRVHGQSAVDVSTLAGGVVAWRQAKRANHSVGASPSAGGWAPGWCGLHWVTPSILSLRFAGVGLLWADEAVSTCSTRNHLQPKISEADRRIPSHLRCACVVRDSRAGADHVAIRDRVEDRSHGRVGDVRDGSRIRSHRDTRETRSRAAGAELRDP